MAYGDKNAGDKEKVAKDTIYKKMQWAEEESKRKFLVIERMNNNIVIGIKKWLTEEKKFDFKYDTAVYFNYDTLPVFIAFFKNVRKNMEWILNNAAECEADKIQYSGEVSAKSGKGAEYVLQCVIKLDKNKEVVMGLTIYNDDKKDNMVFRDNPFGKTQTKIANEVVKNDVENQNLVLVAVDDVIERLKSYCYDTVKSGAFLTKMLDGSSNTSRRDESEDEYPF